MQKMAYSFNGADFQGQRGALIKKKSIGLCERCKKERMTKFILIATKEVTQGVLRRITGSRTEEGPRVQRTRTAGKFGEVNRRPKNMEGGWEFSIQGQKRKEKTATSTRSEKLRGGGRQVITVNNQSGKDEQQKRGGIKRSLTDS